MTIEKIKTYAASKKSTQVKFEASGLTVYFNLENYNEAAKGLSKDLLKELNIFIPLIERMDTIARSNDRWYGMWVATTPNTFKIFDVDADGCPYDEKFLDC